MNRFNLSDWALQHRSFVWFLMIVSIVAGTMAYFSIGREEDPNFAIKTMVIASSLPGADVEETRTQVTDRIEKKLEDLAELDFTRSITRPGEAIVYVNLRDTVRGDTLPQTWQKVRNMMNDIRGEFPDGFSGFAFNDDFGDVFGNLYAFTSDGFSPREVRDYVERTRRAIQQLDDSGKINIFGTRDEVVYMEYSTERLAALGLNQQAVQATLAAQNAILPSGVIDAGPERVMVRIGGQFTDAGSLEDINLRVDGRFFRLTDVADIRRGYEDPPSELFRYNGQEAIGLAVGMRAGANIVDFGAELEQVIAQVQTDLPVGVEIHQVADQPHVVDEAVGHFIQALIEAVLIVLAVSFVSLGMRAGFVVTLTIPLVLAITFIIMDYLGFTLQRISLGALIIALGLLVDDAMIAIETMISRLEKGESLTKSASYAWTSIAFPMLSGTLVTVAGFIPIGLNSSSAGEFTFSLFVVIAVSLLVSWVVAVLFAPLLGVTFLPAKWKHHNQEPGRVRSSFHRILRAAMRFRWVTIGVTVVTFALSVWGLGSVENQFFPSSDRPELIVDMTLPQNASISETKSQVERLETLLEDDENVLFQTSYIGRGAPRFILAYDVLTPGPNTAQIVIQTPSVASRDALRARIETEAADSFPGTDVFVKLLEVGPPVGRPVQYRLSGPEISHVRDLARELAAVVSSDPRTKSTVMDWNEPARVVRVNLLQDKARQLGISSSDIAAALNAVYDGTRVTQLRDAAYLIDIIGRGDDTSRQSVEALKELQLNIPSGVTIPLQSVATFEYGTEQPVLYQRGRMPTVTVMASISTDDQPATVVNDLVDQVAEFRDKLPYGYAVEVGGSVESSAESQGPIATVVPLMMLIMLVLIMIQMQSFRLGFVVLCAAPLGLIGVVAALLLSGAPLGFVAILGVLALVGILIRNSIILVHEIEVLRKKGRTAWAAVFEASDSRARPILLTAAAASLALIPISRQIFWGPMAYAMMGGIIVGTIITLLFVPALYLAVFRVEPDTADTQG
ncbi:MULTISPECIES: efflux RND transporter permease subunit [Roseobacteraceae]|uniref:Cobalt-zinc-cadmium resistance protein CzcA n=1 Tax=Pseudosulfitobacter pseudonitzschiae TaxID=1402135 RepID=A0A221JWR8_9RHOB|nr:MULTISPECIES: efflux RND transporter permease subunit [Roseobacteraceae]ASM71182.1 cobalt-zinc-cadmium resistance protein CzcA [Pseudosulfitobacter pseudonitzschiae]